MGHNARKKKKGKAGHGSGGGRRGRAVAKDHSSQLGGNQDALAEELTALAAIYQEDFEKISEPPHTQFNITLRPFSDGMGFGDLNVSAILVVRCSPGYPQKCPKLQIVPEKYLSNKDADRLLALLLDQANIYAREGRVMIYDLVEAAQEFLSEIAPPSDSFNPALHLGSSTTGHSSDADLVVGLENDPFPGFPYIYSPIDLFSDLCGDTRSWVGHGTKVGNDGARKNVGSEIQSDNTGKRKANLENHRVSASLENFIAESSSQDVPRLLQVTKYGAIPEATAKLKVVAEETVNDHETLSTSDREPMIDTSERKFSSAQRQLEGTEHGEQAWNDDDCGPDCGSSDGPSYVSVTFDDVAQNKKKDLLLVHLLRLACASKESLSDALPEISSELCNLGVLSEWAKDLVSAPPSVFGKSFGHAFVQQMISSKCSQFWKPDSGGISSSKPNSRYLNDFEEVSSLGHGGFGHVALCRNKLDGRQYAVKRIRLNDKSPHVNEKILREVATLSRLQHQHVVRYYQAWVETEYGYYHLPKTGVSRTAESSTFSYEDIGLSDAASGNKQESTYLYIQMEYCPRTLRQDFESYSLSFDMDYAWHLFRQIVEGLAHVHSQGIIHRDLTPSNIFFDGRNDIKIGDFGLAKFLKLEQLDHDQYLPTEATGVSMDGTGQVGTYFYTAPEIEQKWPQINEKVDMYSLGIIFFELWHPFGTAMERYLVLSDLKMKGDPPVSWTAKFPDQSNLLRRLLSPSPSDRPSAIELLQNELPPRMEDEWLNDVLRMIHAPEDTYVYDRVISTIFNENRPIAKSHLHHSGSTKAMINDSFMKSTDLGNERMDSIIEVSKEVFKHHCAKRFEISPLRMLDDYFPDIRGKTVKLLTQGGNMLELCCELRMPFVMSIATNQISSFKRYEISWVHRRAIGHSTPDRFLQGDFDIVGGATPITEAEVIKVAMDIATRFFHSNAIDVRLNHFQVLASVWTWAGVPYELVQNVSEILSRIVPFCPNSTNRKSNWKFIRRQLLQDLHLPEAVVNKLHRAGIRFCGPADQAIARLRGTLSYDKVACKALEDLSALLRYLRLWSIDEHISIDVLMSPMEPYYRDLFFQVYLKETNLGSSSEATLLAGGGRYDHLVEKIWDKAYKSNHPGAVGVSIALANILTHSPVDMRLLRIEPSISVLVCSRGGGGLLQERMEFIAELWQANIKAEFVPQLDPSLKEQYEYANDHDIKCLLFITEAGLSQTDVVKVRHLELKKEKEVRREEIIKFLSDAVSSQFRNPTIWS